MSVLGLIQNWKNLWGKFWNFLDLSSLWQKIKRFWENIVPFLVFTLENIVSILILVSLGLLCKKLIEYRESEMIIYIENKTESSLNSEEIRDGFRFHLNEIKNATDIATTQPSSLSSSLVELNDVKLYNDISLWFLIDFIGLADKLNYIKVSVSEVNGQLSGTIYYHDNNENEVVINHENDYDLIGTMNSPLLLGKEIAIKIAGRYDPVKLLYYYRQQNEIDRANEYGRRITMTTKWTENAEYYSRDEFYFYLLMSTMVDRKVNNNPWNSGANNDLANTYLDNAERMLQESEILANKPTIENQRDKLNFFIYEVYHDFFTIKFREAIDGLVRIHDQNGFFRDTFALHAAIREYPLINRFNVEKSKGYYLSPWMYMYNKSIMERAKNLVFYSIFLNNLAYCYYNLAVQECNKSYLREAEKAIGQAEYIINIVLNESIYDARTAKKAKRAVSSIFSTKMELYYVKYLFGENDLETVWYHIERADVYNKYIFDPDNAKLFPIYYSIAQSFRDDVRFKAYLDTKKSENQGIEKILEYPIKNWFESMIPRDCYIRRRLPKKSPPPPPGGRRDPTNVHNEEHNHYYINN